MFQSLKTGSLQVTDVFCLAGNSAATQYPLKIDFLNALKHMNLNAFRQGIHSLVHCAIPIISAAILLITHIHVAQLVPVGIQVGDQVP